MPRGITIRASAAATSAGIAGLSPVTPATAIAIATAIWNSNPTVRLESMMAYRHFTGFTIGRGPFALFSDDLNTVAIHVDANATEGWRYEGTGLYRHA